eukprot:TRINITY_DN657_c0_g1_i4.p1 TRINITY_DN657_c0_g1~~TRINITY_DN657_c0_g1_i4.p1  ORF type:complete len:277 (-),score=32.93 TRINITY_DN657_c0_g1_i4:138-968(-)
MRHWRSLLSLDTNWAYYRQCRPDLAKHLWGRVVAIDNHRIIATAHSFAELQQLLDAQGAATDPNVVRVRVGFEDESADAILATGIRPPKATLISDGELPPPHPQEGQTIAAAAFEPWGGVVNYDRLFFTLPLRGGQIADGHVVPCTGIVDTGFTQPLALSAKHRVPFRMRVGGKVQLGNLRPFIPSYSDEIGQLNLEKVTLIGLPIILSSTFRVDATSIELAGLRAPLTKWEMIEIPPWGREQTPYASRSVWLAENWADMKKRYKQMDTHCGLLPI